MSTAARNRVIGFVIAAAIFAADQAMKYLVVVKLGMRDGDTLPLLPFFAFTRTPNNGVSLGLFPAGSDAQRWALVAVTALIALGVTVWMLRERKLGDIVPLALVLGGAVGNILDRVRLGYVIDYADLHFGTVRPFLINNLADDAVVIGVLIILARSLFMREKPPETQSAKPSEPPEADQSAETH